MSRVPVTVVASVFASALIRLGAIVSSSSTPDIVIRTLSGTVTATVGQTIGLVPPDPEGRWQLDYDSQLLVLIAPEDSRRVEAPGPDGWVWKALKAGESPLVLTGRPRPCPQPPCAPTTPRFTFTVMIAEP